MGSSGEELYMLLGVAISASKFAETTIACEVNGDYCRQCQHFRMQFPEEFLFCRTYDKYSPNLGTLPDVIDLYRYRLVNGKARCAIEKLPGKYEYFPARLVENPERRKRFGKRRAKEFDEEFTKDLESEFWRLSVRTVLTQRLPPMLQGNIEKCACGDDILTPLYGLPLEVELSNVYQGGLFQVRFRSQHYEDKNGVEYLGATFADKTTVEHLTAANLSNLRFRKAGVFV